MQFTAIVYIIDINPYVLVPDAVLTYLQKSSNKLRGPFSVKGTLQGESFLQTVVKFRGAWRLYLNTPMREAAHVDVGDTVTVTVEFDSKPRVTPTPKQLASALAANPIASTAFDTLTPYRQKEIKRYINSLKSEEAIARNIEKVLRYLTGRKTAGVLFR
ncbi:MAG: hypothetical protein RI947_804 [Candidatus Parcubacteria bacterium]|jgi:hypothetical protein